MSDINKLILDIQRDTALLETVKYFAQNSITPEAAVVAVKGSGYEITEDEWISVFRNRNGELDESTLELVVGGLVLYPPENPTDEKRGRT